MILPNPVCKRPKIDKCCFYMQNLQRRVVSVKLNTQFDTLPPIPLFNFFYHYSSILDYRNLKESFPVIKAGFSSL